MTAFVTRKLSADFTTPVRAYATIYEKLGHRSSFLFESVTPGERWGRYSIIGCLPATECVYQKDDIFALIGGDIPAAVPGEPLIEQFSRALVGAITYDAVNPLHKVEPWPETSSVARMMSQSTILLFDNLEQTLTIGSRSENVVKRCELELKRAAEVEPLPIPDRSAEPHHLDVMVTDAAYKERVLRAKEYIAAGDAFQIVLARRFTAPMRGSDPFDVYRALRVLSPSPYLYFVHFAETNLAQGVDIAGASPETMVRHDEQGMTLRPIAGTRPRGATPEEDRRLADELLADPKECAEHVMLVDLARNDAGRVCEPGSVKVTENLAIERYSHVMHIVSEVNGKPRADVGAEAILRAGFPAGTLTGAPKVRATQIIRELETEARGHYGGAIGYVMPGGKFDLAIAIRTVVAQAGYYEVTAGAGIVEGSDPDAEAQETRNKARAALAAIRSAQDAAEAREARQAAAAAKKPESPSEASGE